MCIRKLLCAAATAAVAFYGNATESSIDFKRVPYGNIPAAQPIVTNVEEVVGNVLDKVDEKADRFILGQNLESIDIFYKLTPSDKDTEGLDSNLPYEFIYTSSTNVVAGYKLYDKNLMKIPEFSETTMDADLAAFALDYTQSGALCIRYIDHGGTTTYVTVTAEETSGRVISATIEGQTTYGYSHPNDWKVYWTALEDYDTATVTETHTQTNVVGQVMSTVTYDTIKNGKAQLEVQYMDEVNAPNFGTVTYTVQDGDATIADNILTATAEGVVTVRATADNGTYRECPVSMYTIRSGTSSTSYDRDAWTNRKRVNDWHLAMLQNYRSNPTTNRVYYTWNEPTSSKHIGYNGDQFTGQYGKHFFPYCHMTVNSGGANGFWWAHGIISKHVLLAANHYGDWNHSRAKGQTAYVNYQGRFGMSRVPVKYVQYYNLNTWAKDNGFEGSDAACGDLGVYVITTAPFDDGANNGIPDAFLPNLATLDWMNENYGYNYSITNWNASGISYGVCGITLNQANTVSLRSFGGPTWSSWPNPYNEGTIITSATEPIGNMYFREDIALLARRCGWHNGILGDSGQPVFLYDPAYTVAGMTHDFGNGPEPLVRPILLSCHTTAGGGTAVGAHLNVIKAFCESIGDTLDHVLGDIDTQSSDSDVIKQRAAELTRQAAESQIVH